MKPGPAAAPSNPSMVETGSPAADDARLVARCRDGDTRAFALLVARHQHRAYGLALRLLRSAPDAEEVTQEAFLRAWRSIGDFRGDASFGTWLYRIVWRRALDRAALLESRRKRETPIDSLEPGILGGLAGEPGGPRGGEAAAPGWLDGLSIPQRAVVTLFYWEDRSVAEVARTLDMPEGTVKTHLTRARAAIRNRMLRSAGATGSRAGRNRGEQAHAV